MYASGQAATKQAIAEALAVLKQAACEHDQFGCSHCLWSGIECKRKSRYVLQMNPKGKIGVEPTCGNYTYCD